MFLFNVFLTLCTIHVICGFPADVIDYGYKELSPEESKLLKEWTEDSKQNIWELSGQFEGDMVLSPEQKNGKVDEVYRWPNNEVPYQLSDDFTDEQKDHITLSLQAISDNTCITLRPATESDADYVSVTGNSGGCHSKVGYIGGAQRLNLAPTTIGTGCLKSGTVVHEFLHALGFHHMQSDSERDTYVTIVDENIKPGKEGNFRKYSASEVTGFGEPYDYGSVLHYSAYAFSSNGEKTIVTTDPNAVIGQRDGLSEIDIKKVNKMYNCP